MGFRWNATVVLGTATLAGSLALTLMTTGCTTKNYVRAQTAPIVQQTNQLDAKTAADHNAIASTDERAQAGIKSATDAAHHADSDAVAAGVAADQAQNAAQGVAIRVDSLSGVVANLDNYKQLSAASVTFGFDKSVLTANDKKELDGFAASLASARGYLLEVTGGTDTTGDSDYNYRLSQRRADAVVQYLSVKYNVAPHKFYLVGIGKDVQVASDRTAAGRAKNRRVEIKLLSNMSSANNSNGSMPATTAAPSGTSLQ